MNPRARATFVLIPGAWHGRWCWERLIPILEAAGHIVVAPELIGMGDDPTPPTKATLAKWADQVAAVVAAQPQPVILVGHSRGGAIVSLVAERVPGRIARLVYLAAFLLPDGAMLMDVLATIRGGRPPSDDLVTSPDGVITIADHAVGPFLYGDCDAQTVDRVRRRIGAEPAAVFLERLHLTNDRFGSVPRTYIETLRDVALPILHQRAMQADLPCDQVFTLDADHSPFYSSPDVLAGVLEDIATR